MPSLDTAFTFAKMNDFTVLIAENLKFNMSRAFEKSLCIDVRVDKGLLRFAACLLIGRKQLFLAPHDAHAAPAATCRGFQDERKADFAGFLAQLLFAFDDAIASRNRWQSRGLNLAARAVLFPHHLNYFGRRPDKGDLGGLANLREVCVL